MVGKKSEEPSVRDIIKQLRASTRRGVSQSGDGPKQDDWLSHLDGQGGACKQAK
jgi:hypothetical protein